MPGVRVISGWLAVCGVWLCTSSAQAQGVPDPRSVAAATALSVDVSTVQRCRDALEAVYRRDYTSARAQLDTLTVELPTSGLGPLGMALLYQALMFENFDYQYERPYELARDQTRAQVEKGLEDPANDALDYFVLAGIEGVDAMHAARKREYLSALARALDATRALSKSRDLAPDFVDADLGDGLYYFWRTVISEQSKALPRFKDRQDEGIALMKHAELEAAFVGPGASLALAYAYMEDHDLKSALARCLAARVRYPNNVINELTIGRIYTQMGRTTDALTTFTGVLVIAPSNQRVHYLQGIALLRGQRYAEAAAEFNAYLAFPDVPIEYRGETWYRIGQVAYRQKDYPTARTAYEKAVEESGDAYAKRALQKMRKQGLGE